MCFRLCYSAPPTTDIYTLSLHDALPIFREKVRKLWGKLRPEKRHEIPDLTGFTGYVLRHTYATGALARGLSGQVVASLDRKSTRLNSSHLGISYAVFCLKKKKQRND